MTPTVIHYTTDAGLPIRLFWSLETEDEIRKEILQLWVDGKLSIRDRGRLYGYMLTARIKNAESRNGHSQRVYEAERAVNQRDVLEARIAELQDRLAVTEEDRDFWRDFRKWDCLAIVAIAGSVGFVAGMAFVCWWR